MMRNLKPAELMQVSGGGNPHDSPPGQGNWGAGPGNSGNGDQNGNNDQGGGGQPGGNPGKGDD